MTLLLAIFLLGSPAAVFASPIKYDKKVPQLAFAARELEQAIGEQGMDHLKLEILIRPDTKKPEAFRIEVGDKSQVRVIGSDARGAMYGGLELAERIRLGLPVESMHRAPFIEKRGIKFNIPFDARTPSYDDTGDAAQLNTKTVWDLEFWKAYLDDLARYRYNVLSLWSTHPYPSIIQLDDYPDVALDDVYRVSDGVFQPSYKNRLQNVDLDAPGTMTLVKEISIKDKIKHWQAVFQHAEDRGIEIYLFHWNVMTFGATGKYGITPDQTNPIAIDYMRKCIREALLTYPQIAGIGVTAGENADNNMEGEFSIENYLFNTYGRGVMDVVAEQPEREVRFIFRRHMSGLGPITEAFQEYPGAFNTSFKYNIGHMYTMRKPMLFDNDFRAEVEEFQVPCFINLRNDDLFIMRWGNPDYVREYLKLLPHDVSPGFYMGSDGYVWGREFIGKKPDLAGKLEIDKHWYRFRQWGLLAYDPGLGKDYWVAALEQRFPGVNGPLLYDAWAAASEVVPQLNSAIFCPNDAHFAPEGCIAREGFLSVDDYYFSFWPAAGSGIHSVEEWGEAVVHGKKLKGISPLQVSEQLDEYAATALAALPSLQSQATGNVELEETLKDIEATAYLGRYYADKMRGAAKLAAFRVNTMQPQFALDAVGHFEDALEEWKVYTANLTPRYKSQLMQRTHYMDWELILEGVEKELADAKLEADCPEIAFPNLEDGAKFPKGSDLRVELMAMDQHGIAEVKLYLNGLLLQADEPGELTWSASGDELLKGMEAGTWVLTALAIDQTGSQARREIRVQVGEETTEGQGKVGEQIHQVILNDGEVFMDSEVLDFPRLECHLALRDDGRLVLNHGAPGDKQGMIWKAMMHSDHGDDHYATLKRGQLITYRGTPGDEQATPYMTHPVPGQGPYQLGITTSKRLVIYRELEDGGMDIVWRNEILEKWRL